jgi:signal transduction histidine kinase
MWEALVEPRGPADAESRRSARLLATLLVLLIPMGVASALIQLALVPGFLPTFMAMIVALAVLSVAYALARTGRVQAGALLTVGAISAACLGAVSFNAEERLSPAFLLLAILLASALLPLRHALALALVDAAFLAAIVGKRFLSVPVLLASAVLFAIGSALILALAVHRDRLERDRQATLTDAATKLRLADRLSTVGLLTAEITHEISSPLTGALCNLELAQRQALPPGVDQYLKHAELGLSHVIEILHRLKPMARYEPVAPQLIEFRPAVDAALRLIHTHVTRRAQLVLEAHAMPYVYVQADATRLGQVIVNLVMNAAQAVELEGSRGREIRVVVDHTAGWASVTVEDTGPGIPPDVLPHLFAPFFTTKPSEQGSGLGLAIAQGIVSDLGGRLEVQSELGRGSRFAVRLPAVVSSTEAVDLKRLLAMRMAKPLR